MDDIWVEIIKHCTSNEVIILTSISKKVSKLCDWDWLYNHHFGTSNMIKTGSMKELFIRCHLLGEVGKSFGMTENIRIIYNTKTIFGSRKCLNSIPPTIGILNNLKELYLNDNNITELPDAICNLVNLKEMNLCRNQISKLPKLFSNLKNLTYLNLSTNKFTELPDQVIKMIESQQKIRIYMFVNSISVKDEIKKLSKYDSVRDSVISSCESTIYF